MTAPATGRIERPVPPSATLAINERIEQRIGAGDDVLHLAFGEAGLPLLPGLAERLAPAAPPASYGAAARPPAGRGAAGRGVGRRGPPPPPPPGPPAPRPNPPVSAPLS